MTEKIDDMEKAVKRKEIEMYGQKMKYTKEIQDLERK